MNTPTPRIFISHSSEDNDFGRQLAGDLKKEFGKDAVWYDSKGGLHGGVQWWAEILKELKACNVFIVVLSPDAVNSRWVNDEIDIAWKRKNSDGISLIPLLYRHCEVREDLQIRQIIFFEHPENYKTDFKKLRKALELAMEELLLSPELSMSRKTSKATSQPIITVQKTPEQWLEEGNNHSKAKQYREAITDFDQAIRLDPNNASAYNGRGFVYFHLQEYQKAIADFDRAFQLNPQSATARHWRLRARVELDR